MRSKPNLTLMSVTIVVSLMFPMPAALAAFSEHTALVVKTYSRFCDHSQIDFRGSGTLFRASVRDPNIYVLTSEHVLLPGTKSTNQVCHAVSYQVKSPQGELTWSEAAAELVATDWQSGLAILKLTGPQTPSAPSIPTYKDLIATKPTGESFDVAGLPYGMERELRTDAGKFAATQSLRHLMPNGAAVFELQDADGEFGMSGGPVFDQGGKLTGLLSHQFLVQRQGRPSAVSVFDAENEPAQDNHLLLIRGADLATWIDGALKPNFAPGFVRSIDDQLSGQDAVYAANMKFTAIPQDKDCTTADQPLEDPLADHRRGFFSIGGGDPVGIGGGDPVGIGGDGPKLPKSILVRITLDRNASALAQSSRWNIPRLNSWHEQVTEAALRNEILEVSSIIYRDPQHPEKGISRVCVRSLEEFFRKITVEGSSAVTHRRGGATDVNPSPQIKALISQGEKMLAASNALHESSDQVKKLQIVQYSRMYGSLLASPTNWSLVRPSDLSPLRCITSPTCPYRSQWSQVFENAATATQAQELAGTLTKACTILKTLTTGDNTPCN